VRLASAPRSEASAAVSTGSGTLGLPSIGAVSGLSAHFAAGSSQLIHCKGDSNGCVSIRNNDRFLKALNDGEIIRLVVVPSLRDEKLASRQST
jgi:hypothetical protein